MPHGQERAPVLCPGPPPPTLPPMTPQGPLLATSHEPLINDQLITDLLLIYLLAHYLSLKALHVVSRLPPAMFRQNMICFCFSKIRWLENARSSLGKKRAPMGAPKGEMGENNLGDCWLFSLLFIVFFGFLGFILFRNG